MLSLKELADKLHVDYYDVISAMVQQAADKQAELSRLDIHQVTQNYTDTCGKLLQAISYYLYDRKEMLTPYLHQLYDKDATGHNCAACSGNCEIGHKSHLVTLRESHLKILSLLSELQVVALPLYSNLSYPLIYKTLRDEMLLIEIVLKELLYVEEAFLMTSIIRSQRKINVHH
jgi:hypothetical protein